MFLGEGVLKICNKFTREHQYQSAISRKLQGNFIEITLRHGCYPVNLLHIFRTSVPKNTSGRLLPYGKTLKAESKYGLNFRSKSNNYPVINTRFSIFMDRNSLYISSRFNEVLINTKQMKTGVDGRQTFGQMKYFNC